LVFSPPPPDGPENRTGIARPPDVSAARADCPPPLPEASCQGGGVPLRSGSLDKGLRRFGLGLFRRHPFR
jgi:hypothetical protein